MRDKEKKKKADKKLREKYPERYKEYDRKYYRENIAKCRKIRNEYRKNNKDKYKVWGLINYHLKKIGTQLAECSICHSKENLIKHHEDYSKPFDIIVLCKRCHGQLHSLLRTSNIEI